MIATRFIFVEGIIGSGKTTTAEFLTDQLQRLGIVARFLPEGPTIDAPVHPLRVAPTLPQPLEVWRDITVDEYVDLSLRRWDAFASQAQQLSGVTVCDGLLFHGNMTDLLLMGAEPAALHRYVTQVLAAIGDLNPVVIYLYPRSVHQVLRSVRDQRGRSWEDYQVTWKTGSPYGRRQSHEGFAGLIDLYQTYRAICDDIFVQLTVPKITIRDAGDWVERYRKILDFLLNPIRSGHCPNPENS